MKNLSGQLILAGIETRDLLGKS